MTPQSENAATVTSDRSLLDECEMYRQGSEACRNYSKLTMRVRTLSQQILAVGVAGLGTALAKEGITPDIRAQIFIAAGVALVALSFSLLVVDWHYQTAFTGIRNSLAFMETRNRPFFGPWIAHFNTRTQFKDHIASYLPFHLLAIIGGMGIWRGINGGPNWLIRIIFTVSGVFLFLWVRAWQRDAAIARQLRAALKEKGFCLDRNFGLVPSKDPP